MAHSAHEVTPTWLGNSPLGSLRQHAHSGPSTERKYCSIDFTLDLLAPPSASATSTCAEVHVSPATFPFRSVRASSAAASCFAFSPAARRISPESGTTPSELNIT